MKVMKYLMIVLSAFFIAQAVSAEVKSRRFTQEEIKDMAETRAVIHTRFGDMKLKFFPNVAPNHANNYIELAKKGFYDGTIFHRVIPGFMIQGGDPTTKDVARIAAYGTGGPGYTLKAEFNSRPHKRGIVSMARTANDPNSAGSQFFICFDMDPRQQAMLDGQYTVFGEVVDGMEVADKIVAMPRDPVSNRPDERIDIKVRVMKEK